MSPSVDYRKSASNQTRGKSTFRRCSAFADSASSAASHLSAAVVGGVAFVAAADAAVAYVFVTDDSRHGFAISDPAAAFRGQLASGRRARQLA